MRTPRTHFMFDKVKRTYFKEVSPGKHEPVAQSRSSADIYSVHDRDEVGISFYGDTYHFTMIDPEQASLGEHATWRCRRAGQARSEAKTRAVRANSKLPKLRWATKA